MPGGTAPEPPSTAVPVAEAVVNSLGTKLIYLLRERHGLLIPRNGPGPCSRVPMGRRGGRRRRGNGEKPQKTEAGGSLAARLREVSAAPAA